MLVAVQFHIPKEKLYVCDWLKQQSPEITAHILELTQTVYQMNQVNTHVATNNQHFIDCIHSWEQKYKEKLLQHQKELADIVDKTKRNTETNHQQTIQQYQTRINELIQTNQKEKEYYTNIIEQNNNAKQKEFDSLTQFIRDSQNENEKLKNSITDLTKLFTGSASNTGIVGENLVHYTFNTLQLGMLDDMRYDPTPGCEDFLWSNDKMLCSVEVKNSKCLHSKHDMDKHIKRISEAAQTNKINCALFISLNARVPNMSHFEIQTHSGIPILYVSKYESLSHQTLIEIAFRLMHIIWNIHKHNTQTQSDSHNFNHIFHDISMTFSQQIKTIAALDDSILAIEKNTQNTFTQLQKLRKSKAVLCDSLDSFYSKYPLIKPLSQNEDPCETYNESQNSLLKSISLFHSKRKKYPKEIKQIKSYLENPEEYHDIANDYGQEFPTIVDSLKKSKKFLKN